MVRLRLLGGASIEATEGTLTGAVAQRRRIALLALLAANPGGALSRERVAAFLFADAPPARALKAVADAVHAVRRALGHDVVRSVGDELRLDPAALPSDVAEFRAALARGDDEGAVAVYGGPFLDGLLVPGASDFDQWVEVTRLELAHACGAALDRLARASEAGGEPARAVGWWRRAAALDPYATRTAVALARALAASGDSGGAVRHLACHEALLRHDLDVEPPEEMRALAARLRAGTAAHAGTSTGTSAGTAVGAAAGSRAAHVEAMPPPEVAAGPRMAASAGAAATLLLVALLAFASTRSASRPDHVSGAHAAAETTGAAVSHAASRPTIAVLLTPPTDADTAARWLAASAGQMIADALARASAVEVLPLARSASAYGTAEVATGLDSRAAGRRLGATYVLAATVAHAGGEYVLDGSLVEVASGRTLTSGVWTAMHPIDLADRVAAGALGAVGAEGPGLRLTELETASVAAYEHFTRALTLLSRGDPGGDRELDRAVALDSGFVSALYQRYRSAIVHNDSFATQDRIVTALRRALPRATERDRLEYEAFTAYMSGEHARSESFARTLVRRYPHDPRGYDLLATIYLHHGRLAAAESTVLAKAERARDGGLPLGACAECQGIGQIVDMRLDAGDAAGALALTSRLVAMHGELPLSWISHAAALSRAGRVDDALAAWRRVALLTGETDVGEVRTLLAWRRLDAADSVIGAMLSRARDAADSAWALDVRALLERERGQMRASARTVDELTRAEPGQRGLRLMALGALARVGDRRELERRVAELRPSGGPVPVAGMKAAGMNAVDARAWTWHAAIAADAVAPLVDATHLLHLADSMQRVGQLSYFARDWRVHHHVRALAHRRAGRDADALLELERAAAGSPVWSRTWLLLADTRLRLGQPAEARRALLHVYMAPMDAMGRYVPRSEADLLMARAFAAEGVMDSAHVYLDHVRRAWRDADPELKRELHTVELAIGGRDAGHP